METKATLTKAGKDTWEIVRNGAVVATVRRMWLLGERRYIVRAVGSFALLGDFLSMRGVRDLVLEMSANA